MMAPAQQRCMSTSETGIWEGGASNSMPVLPDKDTHLDIQYNGRQSVSGVTATVFGAYGFVGRYVVNRLGRIGSQVVIPYRGDGMNTRHLRVMGDLGQIIHTPMQLTDVDSIRESIKSSNVVINLLGSSHETKNYSFDDVNVKCVHRIAKTCAESGLIKRFIHVSANNASLDSASAFLRSKAEGEQVVRDFFPQATIMRPTPVFGHEDKFLNRMADMVNYAPVVPQIGYRDQQIQPIYVQDLAQAIVNAMVNSDAPGKTYELGGPEIMTRGDVYNLIKHDIVRPESSTLGVPSKVCRLVGQALQALPVKWRLISPDDVDQSQYDLVVPKFSLTCGDLGVKPVSITKEGPPVLMRHRGNRDAMHHQWHEEYPKSLEGFGKVDKF